MHGEKLVIIIAMSKLFLISKEEAFHICDKSQYHESTLWEKVKLTFRYLWCRTTRLYVIRNKKLTKAIQSSNLECLNANERQLLESQLKKQLKNQV
jgi:hypothetical protein